MHPSCLDRHSVRGSRLVGAGGVGRLPCACAEAEGPHRLGGHPTEGAEHAAARARAARERALLQQGGGGDGEALREGDQVLRGQGGRVTGKGAETGA